MHVYNYANFNTSIYIFYITSVINAIMLCFVTLKLWKLHSGWAVKIAKVAQWLGLRPRPRWGSLQRSPIPPCWMCGDPLWKPPLPNPAYATVLMAANSIHDVTTNEWRIVMESRVHNLLALQWKPWYMTLKFFSCSSMFGIGFNNNGMN